MTCNKIFFLFLCTIILKKDAFSNDRFISNSQFNLITEIFTRENIISGKIIFFKDNRKQPLDFYEENSYRDISQLETEALVEKSSNLDSKQIVRLCEVLKDSSTYKIYKEVKNGCSYDVAENLCIDFPSKNDIYVFLKTEKGIIELLLSSNNQKFSLRYREKNMLFLILDSCINQDGWTLLEKWLIGH